MTVTETLHQAALWATTSNTIAHYRVIALPKLADVQLSSVQDVVAFYRSSDPFIIGLACVAFLSFTTWFMSILTGNYSQVDRIWSLLPPFYSWHFTLHDCMNSRDGQPNVRLVLVSTLMTLWGARLTFNFWRKGGYKWKEEDYRWPYLRQAIGPVAFQLLNATFIAPYQNILLYLISLPVYIAYLNSRISFELNAVDLVATVLFLALLAGEFIADHQQWVFQSEKARLIKEKAPLKGDYKRGFLASSGLWKYSRHPNFFCEISTWWVVYLFSVAATAGDKWGLTGAWLNWTILGAVMLTMLFQGSTELTEYMTGSKYPAYKQYQEHVPRITPWPRNAWSFEKED
ncbi:hypothetical protein BZG36_01290 [Bifiguratus adelaidae]|uniref:Steroid 5-alpha reductase C-terminal domain-containing protein n=1 Tax=Bifiguratus adelaidae TaxID=1938954 RepID=A0A261Y568_9FUNG|nr:hypothetical protein BZG36_01290 [Bifiguratus adelaidae]